MTPARTLKTLYVLYLLIIVWAGILPWLIPLAFFSSPLLTLGISLPLLLVIVFALWWIGAYYRTIRYRFTPFEISWERGVWFRQTGIVPFNRITNIDIIQGPISRFLGISLLKVQTAGYALPLLLVMVFALWWIGAYYRTIRYRFTLFEISWNISPPRSSKRTMRAPVGLRR